VSNAAFAPLLTQEQVAEVLQVSPRTLEDWRLRGGGPPFIKPSRRCVRYSRTALEAWVERQTVSNTTQGSMIDF
jgi:excisionase family DNA binding protein